jgi:hypothetical protein
MTEPTLAWRISTYSGQASTCVEVAAHPGGHVLVRNSNNPEGATLALSRDAVAGLLDAVKDGALDSLR